MTTPCACCYCGFHQAVPVPPALVECAKCRRPFRVLVNEGQRVPIELGDDAKLFYRLRPKRIA